MRNSILGAGNKKSVRKIIMVVCIIIIAYNSYSQSKNTFIVNPGQKISDVVPAKDMYHYADFKPGTVIFKDQRESSAPMNYNLLLNEFQFINPNGDTLSIADANLIKLIRIDNDTFYYTKGCYKLISSFRYIRLVRKETIYMASVNKIGAYNQPVQGGSASSYTNFSSGGRDVRLAMNEKITLKKEAGYYFADGDDRISPASKKNLEKELPKYSSVIEEYISNNTTDFKKEEDLERLFNYLKEYKF